jgi:hypothetical protein
VPIRSPRRRILHRGSQMDGDAKSGGAPTIIMQRCGGWRKITNHGPCRIRFGFSQEEMRKRRRQMFREYNHVLFHIQLSKVQPQERAFTASKTNCNQKTLHSYVPPVPLPPSHTVESSRPFPPQMQIYRHQKADCHHPFLVSSGHPQVDVLCDPSFVDK